jgi:hypothetical protein
MRTYKLFNPAGAIGTVWRVQDLNTPPNTLAIKIMPFQTDHHQSQCRAEFNILRTNSQLDSFLVKSQGKLVHDVASACAAIPMEFIEHVSFTVGSICRDHVDISSVCSCLE